MTAFVPIGPTLSVSGPDVGTVSKQGLPVVAGLAGGGEVVIWVGTEPGASGPLYGRVYDAGGQPLGTQFLIAPLTVEAAPAWYDVASRPDGSFVVTWTGSSDSAGDVLDVRAQIFSAAGNAVGSEIIVSQDSSGGPAWPSVAVFQDGSFVISYQDYNLGVDAKVFSASGQQVGSEIHVTLNTGNNADVVALAGGQFGVIWEDARTGTTLAQMYSSQYAPVGSTFTVDQSNTLHYPAVPLSNGNFVVVWETSADYQQNPNAMILGQIFDPSGHLVGSQFVVNTTTAGVQSDPTAIPLKTGGFLVGWTNDAGASPATSTLAIQQFDSTGNPIGTEHSIQTNEGEADMSAMANGGFVAAWENSQGMVQAQVFKPVSVHNDFNGDGRSDVFLYNPTTLQVTDWLSKPDGSFAANATNYGISSAYHIAAVGDFNGDGIADAINRNDASGRMVVWPGSSSGSLSNPGQYAIDSVGPEWQIVGTGDFNGDGNSDVLFRNSSGYLTDWLGSSTGPLTSNQVNAGNGSADSSWSVVGIGDFNGDGRSDILWRNTGGYLTEWLGTANGGFVSNQANAGNGSADNTWQVAGTGDFNGDGLTDILWRNAGGYVTEWLGTTNGGFVSNQANAGTGAADSSWQVVGTGDFNGDGKTDILWRNNSGYLTEWLGTQNGSFISNQALAGTALDPSWHVLNLLG